MLLFIIVFLASFFYNDVCVADPLFTFCTNEYRNYTHNSLFENNLKQLLDSLASNNLYGSYDTSIGTGQDEVYGQAMCRGDVTNSTVCQNCIENASQDILSKCMSQEAMIWYNFCQIRYSFHTFTSIMTYTGKFPKDNGEEKEVPQNPEHFAQVLEFLMKNISKEAAYDASKKMFATGEIKYSLKNTIYGLVQCTRDISPSKCDNCLSSATGDLMACCSFRQGGMVLSRNCNIRFSTSRFFNNPIYSLTYPESHGSNLKSWMLVLIIIFASVLPLAILSASCIVHILRKQGNSRDEETASILIRDLTPKGVAISTEEVLFVKLEIIKAATNYFSATNKLGEGGFGTVYKGVLEDGSDIAVKRLSRNSWQGLEDLKNEAMLIAKLQHKNLVRLLGCVVEEEETMLLYEFMPNGSLDKLIFDSERRSKLDWKIFYNIIIDIARGLLYLHEDSRLKIIHRDLKPSNVLLDHEMVAKISDFGMARIFGEDQKAAKTKRVAGTLGYMSPEYAMHGLFSFQSDVFGFGVILLEILSGKRNSGFYQTGLDQTLLAYAWRLWTEGKELEFVEPSLIKSGLASSQAIRCMHIGLLCVQVDPQDRPDMSSIVFLLGKESMELPKPKQPPLSMRGLAALSDSSTKGLKSHKFGFSDISAR